MVTEDKMEISDDEEKKDDEDSNINNKNINSDCTRNNYNKNTSDKFPYVNAFNALMEKKKNTKINSYNIDRKENAKKNKRIRGVKNYNKEEHNNAHNKRLNKNSEKKRNYLCERKKGKSNNNNDNEANN